MSRTFQTSFAANGKTLILETEFRQSGPIERVGPTRYFLNGEEVSPAKADQQLDDWRAVGAEIVTDFAEVSIG